MSRSSLYLKLYSALMAVVCIACVVVAVAANQRAAADEHWRVEGKRWEAQGRAIARRDAIAVARYKALATRYTTLTKTITVAQTALAAEINRARKTRPKVITGATIVSYVSG